ncbi:MAG: dATP pyrophosphohydrolase [Bacteroidetes bacterium]|nr:dATP pyrophosphohydrolase [Bacteroidota bacterium]
MIPIVGKIIEVCVFRFNSDLIEYLVLRRAPDERLHPGMWQIITGMVEEGEQAVETALRELKEETGFAPEHFWSLPQLTTFFDVRNNAINLCPVFAAQVKNNANPVLSGEHTSFAWLPPQSAQSRLVWPSHRAAIDLVDQYIVRGEEAAYRLKLDVS